MIFPTDRISDLKRDVEIRRERFMESQDRLVENTRAHVTPMAIFKGSLLGTVVGLAGFFFAGKFIMKGGIFSKIFKAALLMGLRKVTPYIKPLFNSVLSQVLKSF